VGPTTAQPLNQHARDLASIRSDVNRSQREGENILCISLIEQKLNRPNPQVFMQPLPDVLWQWDPPQHYLIEAMDPLLRSQVTRSTMTYFLHGLVRRSHHSLSHHIQANQSHPPYRGTPLHISSMPVQERNGPLRHIRVVHLGPCSLGPSTLRPSLAMRVMSQNPTRDLPIFL